jgi:uncharacterized protein (TIGR02246 family)
VSSDELRAAVGNLFDELADAWNRADATDFGERFADDADFVEIRGGHHVGRPSIERGHEALWNAAYAGSTLRYDVEKVRPVVDGIAVVIVGATMTAPTGPLTGTNRSRITAVVTRTDDRLRITSFHNTLQMA